MANRFAVNSEIDQVLQGSRRRAVVQEFFTNTLHYPVVLILLEMIPEWPRFFSTDPAFYALLLAAGFQAFALGTWQNSGRPRPLLGNLIAPTLYTLVEVILEGPGFFEEPRHVAFWIYALLIGLLQQLRLHTRGLLQAVLILLENVVRTSILLVGYWIFESFSHPGTTGTLADFLQDDSHIFVALATLFIGLMLGFANLTSHTYLVTLKEAANRLRLYSEWLLGRTLLSRAMQDPTALALMRQERAVLFMDIRGFTNWSEGQSPETVVKMLDAYFETGERVWNHYQAIKTKLNADEIMLIFPDILSAACAALDLQREESRLLAGYDLSAGTGLHYGPVVEGVMGSREVKAYDVIGDVVNTAKRICDQAAGGEILISRDAYQSLGLKARVGQARALSLKGKEEETLVYSLLQMA